MYFAIVIIIVLKLIAFISVTVIHICIKMLNILSRKFTHKSSLTSVLIPIKCHRFSVYVEYEINGAQ